MSRWWFSTSSSQNRRQQCTKNDTVCTSDVKEVTTTDEGGEAVQEVTNGPSSTSNMPSSTSKMPSSTSKMPSPTTSMTNSTSSIPSSTSKMPSPTSNIPSPTSDMPSPTSDMPSPTSDIPSPTSDMPIPISDMPSPTSDMPSPTSDMPSSTNNMPNDKPVEPLDGFSKFQIECLEEHNIFRARHGVEPLKLSRNICNYAQEWANHLASTGSFEHRTAQMYGENLYMSTGMQIDGRTAVRAWYDEVRMYKYGSGFSGSTGHFTQVVWKSSKELGVAVAYRGNSTYVVANYSPPGNYQSQFAANVLPPTSDMPSPTSDMPSSTSNMPSSTNNMPNNKRVEPLDGFSKFQTECLDEHNIFRARHGAEPLTLSRNISNYAQEWANHLASTGSFEHRTAPIYGENLYMSTGMQIDGRTAVRAWYDEVQMYKYGSGFSASTGHFTQVVWKSTKELGVAVAYRGNSTYVVANYSPPGNYQGQFAANVLPPRS